jgi:hypothetical protein
MKLGTFGFPTAWKIQEADMLLGSAPKKQHDICWYSHHPCWFEERSKRRIAIQEILKKSLRFVTEHKGETIARDIGAEGYLECSGLSGG